MQVSQQVASIRDVLASRLLAVIHGATSEADMSFAETLASSRYAEPEGNRARNAPAARSRAAEVSSPAVVDPAVHDPEPIEEEAKTPERMRRSLAPPSPPAEEVAYVSPGAAPVSPAMQSVTAAVDEAGEEASAATTSAGPEVQADVASGSDAQLVKTAVAPMLEGGAAPEAAIVEAGAVEGAGEGAGAAASKGIQSAGDANVLITPTAQEAANDMSVQPVLDSGSWKAQFLARLLGEPHGAGMSASPAAQGDPIAVTVAVTADAATALQSIAGQPGATPVAAVEGAPGATGVTAPVVATLSDNSVQATGQPGRTDLGLQAKTGAMKGGAASTLSAPLDADALREVAVRSVRIMLARGEQTVTVRLSPPSLGELHVQVTSGREGLTVRLASANPAVREALNGQLEQLEQALVQADSGVTGLSVSFDLGPALDQAGRQAAQGDRSTSRFIDSQGRQDVPADASTLSTRAHTPHDGALDVVV